MWRWIARLMALSCLATLAAHGQDSPPSTLFSKCSAFRVELVLGRVVIVPMHRGQARLEKIPKDGEETREHLTVNNDGACPLIRFERTTPTEHVHLEVSGFRDVKLMQMRLGESQHTVEFRQSAKRPIQLIVQNGSERSEVQDESLWHLLLSEPQLCQRELLPMLEILKPGWNLAETAERIEADLLRRALAKPQFSRRELASLVNQLNSPQYRERQEADKQLRACGSSVLPYLNSIPPSQLSCEQRNRINQIVSYLASSSADAPDRTVLWLAADERTWLNWLSHSDPQRRHLATIRLASMRSDDIHFDPYGDESYRQEQLAQLREQIGFR